MFSKSFVTSLSKLSALLTISALAINTPIFLNSASALTNKNQDSEGGGGVVDKPERLPTPDPATKPAKIRIPETGIFKGKLYNYKTTLEGNINGSSDANKKTINVACSSIGIKLLMHRDIKDDVKTGFGNPTPETISEVKATGSTLDKGCAYKIEYSSLLSPTTKGFSIDASTDSTVNSGHGYLWSTSNFTTVPHTLNLTMNYMANPR